MSYPGNQTTSNKPEKKDGNYFFSTYAVRATKKLIPAETDRTPDEFDETVGFMLHFMDESDRILKEINEIRPPKHGDPLKMSFDARGWVKPLTNKGGLFPTTDMITEVNSWAESKNFYLTLPLIRRPLDPSATIVIAASLSVVADWEDKFDPCQTFYDRFYLLNDHSVRAPFMTSKKKQYIREFRDFKILRLPLKQGEDTKFNMFLLLPNDKRKIKQIRDDIAPVEADFIQDHYPDKLVEVCNFRIPKFEINSSYSPDVISLHSNAYLDFNEGGIRAVGAVARPLKVNSKGFHKKHSYDQHGRAEIKPSTDPATGKKFDFVADHPFLIFVREDKAGAMAYLGAVFNAAVKT